MKRIYRFAVCVALCIALLSANLMTASSASPFFSKAQMLYIDGHIEADAGLNEYATVQGACVDGDYAYFAFMQGSVCNIAKFDAHTWEYIEKEKIVNMGHSNDMTYNSDKDYLVVANNAPYYDVITLIDPDTLAPIKDVKIDEEIYSIAYNAKHQCYVVGLSGTYDFALLDSDFKVIEEYEGVKTGYTRQGCDCDDDYIYFVQSGGNNLLVVYDYDGKHVTDIPLTDSDEVENIFHIGSTFYTSLYYYGNTLYRIGFSDKTKIGYTVSYNAGGGEGEMEPTRVNYGESTPLRACTFTREGYTFEGWRVKRTSDGKYIGYRSGSTEYEWLTGAEAYDWLLYDDEEPIATTVRNDNLELTAMWIADNYTIYVNGGDGAGEPLTYTQAYAEDFTVPDGGYMLEGYIFDGYIATRDYDGRVYGYRENSDKAQWLEPGDAFRAHRFYPGDTVSKLTKDGAVTLTAQYKFAYTFGEGGSTLVEYVGTDEKVEIPSNGELTTLAQGAIKDNEIITDLVIPEGVSSLEKESVANCPKLRSVTFEGSLPDEIDGDSILGDEAPVIYEEHNGERFWIGFFNGQAGVPLLRLHSDRLSAFLQTLS
jgi:hypothetical protein